MLRPRFHLLLTIAFMTSVMVHAALLLLVGISITNHQRRTAASKPHTVAIMLPSELTLGLDAPVPPSETWLGFTEPQEHLAPHGPVEQAAFSENKAEQIDLSDSPAQERTHQSENQNSAPDSSIDNTPMQEQEESFLKILKAIGVGAAAAAKAAAPSHEAEPPPTPHQPPAQAGAASDVPSPTAPPSGTEADKESTPSSVIDIPPEQWKLGRPLATQGLELKPRRPTLTVLTLMTAAPGNPVCRIDFDRQGVPRSAAILIGTGDRRVDDAILASLYRWRAAGRRLQDLQDDQIIEVTMQLLLTRQRSE